MNSVIELEKYLEKEFGIYYFNEAKKYNSDIRLYRQYDGYYTGLSDSIIYCFFSPIDTYHRAMIKVTAQNDGKIIDYSCDCNTFWRNKTCEHIPAAILKHYDIIFPYTEMANKKRINDFLMSFNEKEEVITAIKEKIGLEIEIDLESKKFKLHIGLKKKYVLNTETKFNGFIQALENNTKYKFGKGFEFDPSCHYFDSEDLQIINFFKNNDHVDYNYYYSKKYDELSDREFNILLEKLKKRKVSFLANGIIINEIIEDFPTEYRLQKKNDDYILKIEDFDDISFYGENKYAIYNNKLYIIPEKYTKTLNKLEEYNLKELKFKDDNINLFKNGLLQKIKSKLSIDENIDNIIICKEPTISLYFDLLFHGIYCDIKINYDDTIVNYFDSNSSIIRDKELENECISELLKLGFKIDENKIFLDDIDEIGAFLEEGINLLSKKYSIFTSKKLDNTNIIKNANIQNTFSIGKDGILSYSFKSNNIENSELTSIVSNIKNKKKYYKLKNGNILNLNDEDIKELNGILNDLQIGKLDESGTLEIPKYKAFYIDSLRSSKYKKIETNNLFDEFIDNFKKYKNTTFIFNKEDEKVLRPYQKEGVLWIYTLYKCDFGGILADEMGLGKSIQTITFIKKVIEEKKDAKILIVCPTSLVYNWKKEFDKFGSELKYTTIHDNKEKRKEIISHFDEYNIFITSYGLIRNDNDEYENKNFEVCVIDEAQSIKNYQSQITKEIKKIKSKFHLALTGTPIENSINEVWSIFDFLMPGYLNNIDIFRKTYGINDIDDDSLGVVKKLKYQIQPFILRRSKKDVIKDLPPKTEDTIYLELSNIQKELYIKELNKTKKEMDEIIRTEGFNKSRFKILQLLMKLRQICVDPSIIYENYNEMPVKLERILTMVKDLIKDDHKILIFSNFKTIINKLEKLFNDNNISTYTITGEVQSKKRMELVEKFNEDDTNCFLITLKSGGTGLNLTGADIVIHVDIWWNPQIENQATDRAHRIGQTKSVSVIKLVTSGTIEEKIIELQNKKKILAENLLKDNDNSNVISNLSENDVKKLLSFSNMD